MHTEIRLASIEDLAIVLPFVRTFHQVENIPIAEKDLKTSLSTLLNNDTLGGIWLIYCEGQAVGYIMLSFGYSLEFGGKDAFIDEFYIQPEFRGLGLGKETLKLIKMVAKELGICTLLLEVDKTKDKAQKLYSDLNFIFRDRYFLMLASL